MRLKYVIKDRTAAGTVRYYYREPGKYKVRIHAKPGTPAFVEEYLKAVRTAETIDKSNVKRGARAPGTLGAMIQHYKLSREYQDLNVKTRAVRDRILKRIDEAVGRHKVSFLEKRHLKIWRDEPEGPEAGNAIIKTLRQVFKIAVEDDLMDRNIALEVAYRKGNRDGWEAWEVSDVTKFLKHHPRGTMAYKALMLLLFTGQRISDVYQMGPQHERNGWLIIHQVKNAERNDRERVRVEIPILAPLGDVLGNPPSHHLAYLTSSYGKPFQSEKSFGNWFKKRAMEAGIDKPNHGLRKALGDLLATMGATEHQIMAILGHSTTKQAEIYTRRANRKRLAGAGMDRLVSELTGNEIVPGLGPSTPAGTFSNPEAVEKKGEK